MRLHAYNADADQRYGSNNLSANLPGIDISRLNALYSRRLPKLLCYPAEIVQTCQASRNINVFVRPSRGSTKYRFKNSWRYRGGMKYLQRRKKESDDAGRWISTLRENIYTIYIRSKEVRGLQNILIFGVRHVQLIWIRLDLYIEKCHIDAIFSRKSNNCR